MSSHGIEFESINVRERPDAMAELEALGVRSVPVVARDSEYVFAQELSEVARFVGVTLESTLLSKDALIRKLDLVLAAAQRYLRQLPSDHLNHTLPGRDRNYLDLVYHLFMIPIAFWMRHVVANSRQSTSHENLRRACARLTTSPGSASRFARTFGFGGIALARAGFPMR